MSDVFIKDDEKDKKMIFERFLTYRRRVARMCCVQATYLYKVRTDSGILSEVQLQCIDKNVIFACQSVLYFYKHLFLPKNDYDDSKKNKKIDEKYLFETVLNVWKNIDKIDKIISDHLKEKWTISRLDPVVRAILRCAVCEILYETKTEIAVLGSEFTNIASYYFPGKKEIGFVNGIIDKIGKNVRTESKT